MNDKFTNTPKLDDDAIARKLNQAAEQTHASDQFAAELEERLRNAHQPKTAWFTQVSPVLRWVALMAILALLLSWSIKTLIPPPQPAIKDTPVLPVVETTTPEPTVFLEQSATLVAQEGGYNFRGGKLLLQQSLPEGSQKTQVFLLNKDEPATREQARALADRFGVQGEMYTAPNYVFNTSNYVISDGKQRLSVYSDRYFSYTAD